MPAAPTAPATKGGFSTLLDPQLGSEQVFGSELERRVRAHDASHFILFPETVLAPKSLEEIKKIFTTAARANKAITFRSGGTSLSGQGVTDSVMLDTRRYFNRAEVLDNGLRVKVQPGITVRQVNLRLAKYSRKLGPDPASESACTLGGVIANNSSGMSCGTEFNTYSTLESMRFLLPSGTEINTAEADADERLRALEPELYEGLLRLKQRIRQNPQSLATIKQQFSMKNTMGYGINAFLDWERPVDILSRLIIGSEGTLAFVSEAIFKTIPSHPHSATGFLVFDNIYEANSALPALIESQASAIELLDSLSLKVGQAAPVNPAFLKELPITNNAALLVEYQAASAEELYEHSSGAERLFAELNLSVPTQLSTDPVLRGELWHLRKGLYTAVAGARPSGTTALLEDIAVPAADLAATCEGLTELFNRYGYENSVIFGHAKDGNIHFMLTDNFSQEQQLERYDRFTEDMVDLVLGYQGTLKAEHGTGRVMAAYVERQYGSELYAVMREIKALCDPNSLLNPGVIISDDPELHLKNIKAAPVVDEDIDSCVECGYCEPVCPSRNLTLTPRQRIVLEREIVTATEEGDHSLAKRLRKDSLYESIQTCAVDGMCQTACPVSINTGDLVRKLRAGHANPVTRTVWSAFASTWSPATKAFSFAFTAAKILPPALVSPLNKAARAVLGADNVQLLTPDLPKGGSKRKRRASQQPSEPAFVYFPSCMNTLFGPAEGSQGTQNSVMKLLERFGVAYTIPDSIDSLCCGTPWSSKGITSGYNTMAEKTLEVLLRETRQGALPIYTDAASCTEGLIKGLAATAPELRVLDSLEVINEHIVPQLPTLPKITKLALHPTCSSTRENLNAALHNIAAAVAQEVFVPPSWGCCGFAGDRGMLHPELTASATALQAQEVQASNADDFASCNRACELGMSRATGKDYRHIAELLLQQVELADLEAPANRN